MTYDGLKHIGLQPSGLGLQFNLRSIYAVRIENVQNIRRIWPLNTNKLMRGSLTQIISLATQDSNPYLGFRSFYWQTSWRGLLRRARCRHLLSLIRLNCSISDQLPLLKRTATVWVCPGDALIWGHFSHYRSALSESVERNIMMVFHHSYWGIAGDSWVAQGMASFSIEWIIITRLDWAHGVGVSNL